MMKRMAMPTEIVGDRNTDMKKVALSDLDKFIKIVKDYDFTDAAVKRILGQSTPLTADGYYATVYNITVSSNALSDRKDRSSQKEFDKEITDKFLRSNLGGVLSERVRLIHGLVFSQSPGALGRGCEYIQAHIDPLVLASDTSDEACELLRDNGLLSFIVDDVLRDYMDKGADVIDSNYTELMQGFGAIVYNCSRRPSNRAFFMSNNIVDKLSTLKERKYDVRLRIIFYLVAAYTLDERKCGLFLADPDGIRFIVLCLSEAKNDKFSHQGQGFHLDELIRGIHRLSVNDSNKKMLMDQGVMRVLPLLLDSQYGDDVMEVTCATIWSLSFLTDEKYRGVIKSKTLQKMKDLVGSSQNRDVVRQANGAIWVLEGTEKRDRAMGGSNRTAGSGTSHIMISYQWSVQGLVKQVRDCLIGQGYVVWLDIDCMEGSTLEAMADAVENASIVIVALTRGYKESENCRTEAEYAFKLHKKIIPLRCEEYDPDGWLGMILGTKLWYDCTDVSKINKSFADLSKAIESQTVPQTYTEASKPHRLISHDAGLRCLSWTNEDVAKWVKDIGLQDVFYNIDGLSGKDLSFIGKLKTEAPEFFYRYLFDHFGLKSPTHLRLFTESLTKLK